MVRYLSFILVANLQMCLQSGLLHSQPKSTVGTPAYIAPEVLSRRQYDGKVLLSSFCARDLFLCFLCRIIGRRDGDQYQLPSIYADCRCLVLWCHIIRDVGGSLPFRGYTRS